MAEDKMTKQQYAAIRKLTRAANRRIERASPGQRRTLEWFTKRMTGSTKWSSAMKGKSFQEAALQIKLLEKFMGARVTRITEWKKIKKANVRKANDTLEQMGYDLTDEELAEILEQIESGDTKEFYRAVNLVQAAKGEKFENWEGSARDIADAIAEKASYQEALKKALDRRKDDKPIL